MVDVNDLGDARPEDVLYWVVLEIPGKLGDEVKVLCVECISRYIGSGYVMAKTDPPKKEGYNLRCWNCGDRLPVDD